MTVRINGQTRDVAGGSTVAGLLAELGFASQSVLVEHNGQALFPREFEIVILNAGDTLELVRVAAGG